MYEFEQELEKSENRNYNLSFGIYWPWTNKKSNSTLHKRLKNNFLKPKVFIFLFLYTLLVVEIHFNVSGFICWSRSEKLLASLYKQSSNSYNFV